MCKGSLALPAEPSALFLASGGGGQSTWMPEAGEAPPLLPAHYTPPPSHTCCPRGHPPSPGLLVKESLCPLPRCDPTPAQPLLSRGHPLGLQALTGPPFPFSVSTVCCLMNSSSRKGEFIEEKDQSFCWKMLSPVLVSRFLTLHFHTQGQHILGIPVQKTKSPRLRGLSHVPERILLQLVKQGRARHCKTPPLSPQVLPRTQSGAGQGQLISLPPLSRWGN